MNRRTFIKTTIAAFLAPLAFVRKTKAILPFKKAVYTALYVYRQFRARGRRIEWSKVGVKEQMWVRYDYNEIDYIDLPTLDSCEGLFNSEDCLIWFGRREVFRVSCTGNSQLPFSVERLDYKKDLKLNEEFSSKIDRLRRTGGDRA